MGRRGSTVSKLVLVVLVPFLLGADKCDSGPVMDLLNQIAQLLKGLEQRVTQLENCDCGGVLAPVCGDDGVTYVNDCKARCAGVAVAYLGECRPPLCHSDGDCAPDEFCEFEGCQIILETSCEADASIILTGACVSVPSACPKIYDPVCGCDGVTYDNDCLRRVARVTKARDGRCEEPPPRCGGIAGLTCPSDDQVCIFPPGTCDVVDNMGECVERPDSCPRCWDPVCGCDGRTYPTPCNAVMAGVSVDYEGQCQPPVCGGSEEIQCLGPDYACIFPPGTCQLPGAEGECVERPEFCPMLYDPVCGCDGKSYSSECEALSAGVSILYEGQCESSRP